MLEGAPRRCRARPWPSAARARWPTRRSSACGGCCATSRAGTPTCTAASSSRPTTRAPSSACCSGTRTASRPRAGTGRSRWRRGRSSPAGSRRRADGETELAIDVPSGRVGARVRLRGRRGRVRRRSATCRPTCSPAACRSHRPGGCEVDVAYGGAIYASLPRGRAGLAVDARAPRRADRARPRDQVGARRHRGRAPPERRPALGRLRDDPLRRAARHGDGPAPAQRRRCSPTARSTARRAARAPRRALALLAADGRLPTGAVLRARVDRRHHVPRRGWSRRCAPRAATRSSPRSRARRYRTGEHRFVLDPRDPLGDGLRAAVSAPPFLDAAAIARVLPPAAAVDALEAALRDGLDPTPTRRAPRRAAAGRAAADALRRRRPRREARHRRARQRRARAAAIQGVYVLFDGETLAPVALLDGIGLTDVRTSRRLRARRPPPRAAAARAGSSCSAPARRRGRTSRALRAARRSSTSPWSAATAAAPRRFAARASAREPAAADAGRRTPTSSAAARPRASRCSTATRCPTTPPWSRSAPTSRTRARSTSGSSARATVVVESRASALREAGDVIAAIEAGAIAEATCTTSATLVRGEVTVAAGRPRLFKSTGMAWEDLVIATAVHAHGLIRVTGRGVPWEACPWRSCSRATSAAARRIRRRRPPGAPAARPAPRRVRRRGARPLADLARPRASTAGRGTPAASTAAS